MMSAIVLVAVVSPPGRELFSPGQQRTGWSSLTIWLAEVRTFAMQSLKIGRWSEDVVADSARLKAKSPSVAALTP